MSENKKILCVCINIFLIIFFFFQFFGDYLVNVFNVMWRSPFLIKILMWHGWQLAQRLEHTRLVLNRLIVGSTLWKASASSAAES